MAEGLGFDRERPDTRLVPAFIVVALALLAGCDGDTLYDRASPDLVPPSVAILAPEAGDDVLAGQAVPIRVVAGDEDGVTSLEIRVSGSFTAAISRAYDPPLPVVEVDTTVTVPAEAEGPAIVSATAINTQGGVAEAEPIQINVALVDSIAPNVRIRVRGLLNEGLDTVQVPTTDRLRLELRDSLLVDVTALDNAGGSGIRLVGVSAVVASSTRTDTLALTLSRDLGVAQPDTVEEAFTIAPPFADSLNLPDSMDIEIYGWTVDAGGTCSVAIADVRDDTFRCDEATYGSQTVTVGTVVPTPHSVIAVTGRGKKLQEAGTIADLLVDTLRARAYLSNLSNNKVNMFLPTSFTWGADVLVASEPWGLALNIDEDTLFVGNSGGTSISFVSVRGTPREDLDRRLVTRNTPLFEVRKDSALTEAGRRRYDASFIDFSDRPQFMAQDFTGRLLYSTKPTAAQRNGTLRLVVDEPGWSEPEARILIRPEDVITQDTATMAIANIDSLFVIQSAGAHDLVELFDHQAGFPNQLIRTGPLQLEAAVDSLTRHPGSDIFWRYGNWDLFAVGFADTTYVDASGDRRWVAFGEGGKSGPSRIVLWDATASRIHSRLLVTDLVNNASEAVRGVDLNEDGSLGASRGRVASYFFRLDLRLQGSVSEVTEGGSGTVLHPDHPNYVQGLSSSERTIAFLGTGDNKVKILDTVHFTERGTIEIRDALAGPLRAAPPLTTDNGGAGRNCSASTCVVAKLYGMTTRGSLVVIDVRRQDILPLP
jgi:hypothetical protein